MAIYKTARFQIKEDSVDICQAAIADFIQQIKNNESGTRLYLSLQENDNPTKFLHYFIFDDVAAEEFHRQTGWVKTFTTILYPELVSDGVAFLEYGLLATT